LVGGCPALDDLVVQIAAAFVRRDARLAITAWPASLQNAPDDE
jgi:hypothetical protein